MTVFDRCHVINTVRREEIDMSEWFLKYVAERERADRAEMLLRQFAEGRDLRRAENLRALAEKVKRLRREVRFMQTKAEDHNRTAWATGLIVHCTGCEAGGPANPEGVTEERVQEVEAIARRLRTWWNKHRCGKISTTTNV